MGVDGAPQGGLNQRGERKTWLIKNGGRAGPEASVRNQEEGVSGAQLSQPGLGSTAQSREVSQQGPKRAARCAASCCGRISIMLTGGELWLVMSRRWGRPLARNGGISVVGAREQKAVKGELPVLWASGRWLLLLLL